MTRGCPKCLGMLLKTYELSESIMTNIGRLINGNKSPGCKNCTSLYLDWLPFSLLLSRGKSALDVVIRPPMLYPTIKYWVEIVHKLIMNEIVCYLVHHSPSSGCFVDWTICPSAEMYRRRAPFGGRSLHPDARYTSIWLGDGLNNKYLCGFSHRGAAISKLYPITNTSLSVLYAMVSLV